MNAIDSAPWFRRRGHEVERVATCMMIQLSSGMPRSLLWLGLALLGLIAAITTLDTEVSAVASARSSSALRGRALTDPTPLQPPSILAEEPNHSLQARAAVESVPPVTITTNQETILVSGRPCRVEWEGNIKRLYWADNGALYAEGEWKDGKRVGIHRSWYESRVLSSEVIWVDGARHGLAEYFADASPARWIARGEYRDAFKDGEWVIWYPTGALWKRGSYRYSSEARGSLREGQWEFRLADGSFNARTGWYEAGKKVSD